MSNQAIIYSYDGNPPQLAIDGGGGSGGLTGINVGAGLTKTGPISNPTINLGFTQANQLLAGTGLNQGQVLNPGSNFDFLRINGSGNLEWHPISAGGVVAVTAQPNNVGYVNNTNVSTPAIGLAFPATQGTIPVGNGTANQGVFTAGVTFPADIKKVLATDNLAPGGCSWQSVTSGSIKGTFPIVEYLDGQDPAIAIDFAPTSVGQIPVSISDPAGRIGTLTPALSFPADTGKVLTTDPSAPSGVKWAPAVGPSGSINTNAPLIDDYSSGNNTISIDFTDQVQGEIPYGDGTAKTGALLAPPTGSGAVGKVLTYTGVVSGQPAIGWTTPVQPVGGDTIIIHSNEPANVVPVPTDKDTQLVLVAGELAASWDKLASQLPAGINYAPECLIKSNTNTGNREFLAVSYDSGPNGRVCDLYNMSVSPVTLIGTFSFETPGGSVADDAQILCYCNGDDPYSATNFWAGSDVEDQIVIGGKFNKFTPVYPPSPVITPYGICFLGNVTAPNPAIGYSFQAGPEIYYGLTNANDPVNDTTATVSTITAFPIGAMAGLSVVPQSPLQFPGFVCGGIFDTIYHVDSGGAPANITGFSAMAVFYTPTTAPVSFWAPVADVIQLGWKINNAPPGPGGCQCVVSVITFASDYNTMWLGGDVLNWYVVNGTNGLVDNNFPSVNSSGFAVYTSNGLILGGNAWNLNSSNTVYPPFNMNNSYDIKFSSALAGHLIVTGSQSAIVDVTTNPISYTWTQLGNAGASVPIVAGWDADVKGYYNSILINQSVNQPSGPAIVGDWMVWTGNTNQEQYVGYITTAGGAVVNELLPAPTGVTAPFVDGILGAYGIQRIPNFLLISGTIGEYEYDPATHPTITFTTTPPMTWKDPSGTPGHTNAVFSTAYNSQSYIASSDLKSWIQIGMNSPNLSYS